MQIKEKIICWILILNSRNFSRDETQLWLAWNRAHVWSIIISNMYSIQLYYVVCSSQQTAICALLFQGKRPMTMVKFSWWERVNGRSKNMQDNSKWELCYIFYQVKLKECLCQSEKVGFMSCYSNDKAFYKIHTWTQFNIGIDGTKTSFLV